MIQRLYYIFFLVCLLGAIPLKGQINPQTAFYWENPYVINPASIRSGELAFFSLAARKQWASFPGSPTTFWATGVAYSETFRSQAGMKILKDKIGYINTLDISLSYAYALRLSYDSELDMGIGGAYQVQSSDRTKAVVEDWTDPIFGGEQFRDLKAWNFHFGLEYRYSRSLIVGISGQNLLSTLRDEPAIWGGTNYLYGRYRTHSLGRGFDRDAYRTRSFARSYDMEYGVCVKQYEDDIQVDGMISLYINRNTQEEKYQVSVFGRSVGEIGFMAGIKLDSELKFLCTYDYNFKTIGRNANGSFEMMISYPIYLKKHCRNLWDR